MNSATNFVNLSIDRDMASVLDVELTKFDCPFSKLTEGIWLLQDLFEGHVDQHL